MVNKLRILFCKWHTYGQANMIKEFQKNGHYVCDIEMPLDQSESDEKSREAVIQILENYINRDSFDIVFSVNFFLAISYVCANSKIKYVSWCNDAPLYSLFYKEIMTDNNIVFSFDRHTVERLNKKGATNVFHLPCFSAVEYYDEILRSESKQSTKNVVSFIGSTYENRSFYDGVENILPKDVKGYLEGVMEAQEKVIGINFLEKMISDQIEQCLKQYITIPIPDNFMEGWKFLFANTFLGVRVSHNERMQVLKSISEYYPLDIYTKDDTSYFPKASNKGTVAYDKEMPFVFRQSKINLNMTIRNIQSGIPLRVFDVLGCGGFLLTNYQEEIEELFENGQDLVEYYSLEDLLEKVGWYLAHDEERNRIAQNGYEKVRKYHTLSNRIPIIMSLL